MERCAAVWVREPQEHHGHWRALFEGNGALHVELGCGKGRFTSGNRPETSRHVVSCSRTGSRRHGGGHGRVCSMGLTNVRFLSCDAARLPELFAPR